MLHPVEYTNTNTMHNMILSSIGVVERKREINIDPGSIITYVSIAIQLIIYLFESVVLIVSIFVSP